MHYVHFLQKAFKLSWRRPLSYRNQSIDLQIKSMDWFLYDNGLRHERVKWKSWRGDAYLIYNRFWGTKFSTFIIWFQENEVLSKLTLSLLNKSSQLVLRKVILAFQNFRLNYFKFIVFFWVFRIFKSSHFENKKDKTVFYMLICKLEASGLTFTCSKSVMFKVNHKNIRTTSLTSFWCFYW